MSRFYSKKKINKMIQSDDVSDQQNILSSLIV